MPDTFGGRLRELRQKRGLTLTAVGSVLGTSKQALSQIEKDKYMPNPHILVALADFYDVSLDYLYGRLASK